VSAIQRVDGVKVFDVATSTFQTPFQLQSLVSGPFANMLQFRKKFRKIKVKFDEAMRQNNDFYIKEQQAVETARHLAQQNE